MKLNEKRAEKRKARERKMKWVLAFVETIKNMKRRRINAAGRALLDDRQRIINSMTNWQRNQAGRACKGDWKSLGEDQLREFATKRHHKANP